MGVTLSKGQKVDLTKSYPGLQTVIVGLGWTISNIGTNFDLDASAFLLGKDKKAQSDTDFVFYNNPNGGNGSIIYSGDNRVGSGVKDDEQISIDLNVVPPHIHRIAFTITIHDAHTKGQNFGQISNSYVRIFNKNTNEELIRFDLGRNFSVETAIVAAELYRHNGEWKFNAIASGFQGGLGALCRHFGITVDDEQTAPLLQPVHQQNVVTPHYQTPQTFANNTIATQTYGGENIICPRCHSSNIRTGQKGFGLGKAAIGGLILGPIGLLGGFIGKNQLKLTCNSCGKFWSPNQTDYVEWANQQKQRAQELFTRYKSQDVLDAVVAGCALVGMADGRLDPSERDKMLEFVHQSQELKVFETQKVVQRFNYFVGRIEQDPIIGRAEGFKALGKVRTKPEIARLIARYCIAIGYADGNFDQNEKHMVTDICRELGLNPAEFLS
ncbi:MAG TPA: TerD family protein [Bacillales bacterium]|nr:TerD family protein [Bacillales bacterium]